MIENQFAQGLGDVLIIGSFGVLLILGFLAYYYREDLMRMLGMSKSKKTVLEQEIEQRLVQIRQLARQQLYRDAAIQIWETMTLASGGFLNITREPNETARQLGVKLMNRGDIDPSSINAIITTFEKARYGQTPLTTQEFKDGLTGLHSFLQSVTEISESS